MATKTVLTIDEFLHLPDSVGNRDVRYELVEGELITVSPGMFRHNRVRDRIFFILELFLRDSKLGTVVAEQSFHLFGNTVRVPDIAFVGGERTLPLDKLPEGAPDLAVEVVSPSNTPHARWTSGSATTLRAAAAGFGSCTPSTARSIFSGRLESQDDRVTTCSKIQSCSRAFQPRRRPYSSNTALW